MSQLTLSQVRQALADYLASALVQADGVTPVRAVASRWGHINPPCLLIAPVTGDFASYQETLDGQVDWTLRVVIVASMADSESGQDILDPYLSVTGPQSVWAAVRADQTLGARIEGFARATSATGYGVMNISSIDYLAASIVVEIGE